MKSASKNYCCFFSNYKRKITSIRKQNILNWFKIRMTLELNFLWLNGNSWFLTLLTLAEPQKNNILFGFVSENQVNSSVETMRWVCFDAQNGFNELHHSKTPLALTQNMTDEKYWLMLRDRQTKWFETIHIKNERLKI